MPRYKLSFKKSYQAVGIGIWEEVTDSALMEVLLRLQEKYDFKILSVKFRNCFATSYIKIKCSKEDRVKIFGYFCTILGKNITEVTYF